MAHLNLLAVIAVFAQVTVIAGKLPSYIKVCKVDENIEACVLAQQETVIAHIRNGDPANKINSFNPMEVKELTVLDNGASRSVAMNITFRNMKIWGLPDGRLKHFWLKPKEKRIEWEIDVPKGLKIEAKYKVNGKILILPLHGDGDIHISMDGVVLRFSVLYDEIKKGRKNLMVIKTTDMTYTLKHLSLRMDNLFNGDKTLGDNVNLVMNENWQEMERQLGPSVSKALALACKPILDRIVSGSNFKEIFPN